VENMLSSDSGSSSSDEDRKKRPKAKKKKQQTKKKQQKRRRRRQRSSSSEPEIKERPRKKRRKERERKPAKPTKKQSYASRDVTNASIYPLMHQPSRSDYRPPPWSSVPEPEDRWVFQVMKKVRVIHTIKLFRNKSFSTFGRTSSNNIQLLHESISRLHCIVQHGKDRVWLFDASAHGTKLNGEKIPKKEYIQCKIGDKVEFGQSTRQYLLNFESGPTNPILMAQPIPITDWENALQNTENTYKVIIERQKQFMDLYTKHQKAPTSLDQVGSEETVEDYRYRMKMRSFQVYKGSESAPTSSGSKYS